jgi:hypothetical protein
VHFGLRLVYMGEWERGFALVTKAIALNPERLWEMARIWNVPDPHVEHMADGLRKAGLAIAPEP